jgi:hypothetical protein
VIAVARWGAFLLLAALLALVAAGVPVPARADTPTPGSIARTVTEHYWLAKAERACAPIYTDPALPAEARPWAYQQCVHDWLAANAPH